MGIRRRTETVAIELCDELYTRLVVDVDHPTETVAQFERMIFAGRATP